MDKNKLFQISEAAHACDISRSTLMRMETKGLIKPAYIDSENGYRYYDNHNIGHILQIEKFKAMGLDTKEITEYFSNGGEISNLLEAVEKRLQELQYCAQELRVRSKKENNFSVQIIKQPAVLCMMKLCVGHTLKEKYDFISKFSPLLLSLSKGYSLLSKPYVQISRIRLLTSNI